MTLASDFTSKFQQGVGTVQEGINTAQTVGGLFGLDVSSLLGISTKNQQKVTGGFNINEFRSTISQDGILKYCNFLTWLTVPSGLQSIAIQDSTKLRDLILRCDTSTLPGVSFATVDDFRKFGYGPIEKKPYLPIFNDTTVSYIADGRGFIQKFFINWMNFIVNFNSKKGMDNSDGMPGKPYEVNYKDSYTTVVSFLLYDVAANKIIEINLRDAFPIAVDSIPLAWDNTDSFMKLNVTFSYTDWNSNALDATVINNANDVGGLTSFQKLMKGVNAVQMMSTSLKKPQSVADAINLINNGKIAVSGLNDLF